MANQVPIDNYQFLKETGISGKNYIFEDAGTLIEHLWKFWKEEPEDGPPIYYFCNGKGMTRAFKYMKEYGEIWMRYLDLSLEIVPTWSSWNTWKVVD